MSEGSPHESAADAFAASARERFGDSIRHLVVFSVHTLSSDRFESRTDHPFIQTVFDEGRTYA